MKQEYLVVFNTCPDADTAQELADRLVGDGLAACVSLLPGIQSTYMWQDKQETSTETLLMIKTRADAYPALEAWLREWHPYELPEILAVPVQNGLGEYLNWIDLAVTVRPATEKSAGD